MRIAVLALPLALAGCLTEDPCGDYVAYMCDCHVNDADVDCDELETIYGSADADLQEQCAVDLEDQQDDDDAVAYECGQDDTGTGA